MLAQMLEDEEDVSDDAVIVVCSKCHLVHYSPKHKSGSHQHSDCQGTAKHKTSHLRTEGCNCVPSSAFQKQCNTYCPHC